MPEELLDREIGEAVSEAAIAAVKDFTIGFGRAGDKPAAKGSGVLVTYKGVHGILTAAHVDDLLRQLEGPIGIVRLNRGLTNQSSVFHLDEANTYSPARPPFSKESEDIAFIHIPTHLVGDFERSCSFLNAERNFDKAEPDSPSGLIQGHAVFGMVEKFSGATTRANGVATTAMKGVLTPGRMLKLDSTVSVLECFAENIPDLPDSFGGTSGGGLWRFYVRKGDDGKYAVVHKRLIGIASFEQRENPPQITCQGVGRVHAMLEGAYREITARN